MAKRNTATQSDNDSKSERNVIQVTIGGGAANQGGATGSVTEETLDSLREKFGAPSPVFATLTFSTWDAAESLALGRKVSTERILHAVPGFVQSVTISWDALSPAQREGLIGYHPAMLPVLLDETVKLRGVNQRYDARARAEGMSRDARTARADEALRSGRALGERVLRGARQWTPPAHLRRSPLPTNVEGIENPEALANTLDTLASWYEAWRATWEEAEVAGYEALQFAPGLTGELRGAAAHVRETQEVLAAAADLTPATQRELDAQDGRVLHVVGKVYAAFRGAAKEDERVVVPDLGRLSTVFERVRTKAVAEEPTPDADPAKPDADPAKPDADPAKPDA